MVNNNSQAAPGLRPLRPDEEALPYSAYYHREPAPPDPRLMEILSRGPMDPAKALPYDRLNDLLDPGYHEVETGYCVLDNGAGYLAVNSVFPDCTVEMLQWWFAWHAAGQNLRYAIWFPPGHLAISVSDQHRARLHDPGIPLAEKSQNIDHFIVEDTGSGAADVVLSFLPPQEMGFDIDRFQASGTACAFGGFGIGEMREGGPPTKSSSIMIHLCREIEGGVEFRSRFWLGYRLNRGRGSCALPPGLRLPVEMPRELGFHNVREYSNLASILPELYREYGPGM